MLSPWKAGHKIPCYSGHLKPDPTNYLWTSSQKPAVHTWNNQTPSLNSHFHFKLNPLFTNTSSLSLHATSDQSSYHKEDWAPRRITLMPSAVQCQQKEVPAPQFKAGLLTQGHLPFLNSRRAKAAIDQMIFHSDLQHVLEENTLEECLRIAAQGQGEKRPHDCQILLFVMINHPHTCLGL